MSHLAQALVGWLIVMGMVLGGVGVLLFTLSAIRALATIATRARRTAAQPAEAPTLEAPGTNSR